jgi:1,4-alpha-glucan branching enzyme
MDLKKNSFTSSINAVDLHLFGKGVHYGIYNVLGARKIEHQGVWGVRFAVWAPEAQAVSVVADFNHWKPLKNPMHSLGSSGIWELFVPGLQDGEKYKFYITTRSGKKIYKTDPYAYRMEERPNTASIVAEVDRFAWSDQAWMDQRKAGILKPHPMNVYEIHPGSWRTPYGKRLGYRDLGRELAVYCKTMGFTHVELMPIQEHPLDESCGWSITCMSRGLE